MNSEELKEKQEVKENKTFFERLDKDERAGLIIMGTLVGMAMFLR
jgi:hypothetical protein